LPGQSGATTGQPPVAPQPGEGGSTLNQFIYTPNANFNGSDSFPFKVNDGQADSAAAYCVDLGRITGQSGRLALMNVPSGNKFCGRASYCIVD
jgi:hypothetical protein